MLRLMIWIWRYIIVGQPRKVEPPPRKLHCQCTHTAVQTVNGAQVRVLDERKFPVVDYCELELCSRCCAENCGCLAVQVKAIKELRA